MRTEQEVRNKIKDIKKRYHHVLYMGSCATVAINAPRALTQIQGKAALQMLYWVLGEEFVHEYPVKGYDK